MRPPDDIAAEAKRLFVIHEGPGVFETTLVRCLTRGAIYKNETWFVMAEKVFVDGQVIHWESEEAPNCWFIHYAAQRGSKTVRDYRELAGRPLEFMGWKRKGTIRIYKWENFYGRRQ